MMKNNNVIHVLFAYSYSEYTVLMLIIVNYTIKKLMMIQVLKNFREHYEEKTDLHRKL